MALLDHGYYSGYRRGYGPSAPLYEVGRASDTFPIIALPGLPETGIASNAFAVWGPIDHGYYGGYFAGYGSGLIWRETGSAVDTLVSWDPYNVGSGGYTGGYLEGYGASVLDASVATDTFVVTGQGPPGTSETPTAFDSLSVYMPPPVFFESSRARDTLELPGYSGGYVAAGYLEPLITQVSLLETGNASDALYTGQLYETGRAVDAIIVGISLNESAVSSDAQFSHSTVVDFTKTLPELSTASDTMQIGGAAQPYPHGLGLTVVVRSGVGSVRTVISGGTLAVVLKSSQSSAALYGDRGKSAAVVQ